MPRRLHPVFPLSKDDQLMAPDTIISPDWLQAPSDSRNDLFEAIPLPPHDTNYAGHDRVGFNTIFPDWLQAPSGSLNEEDWDWDRILANNHFTNDIPVAGTQIIEVTRTVPPIAAADSATSPRNNPNGRTSCTYEGCFKTFGRTADFRRHLKKHNPDRLHCRQCNYRTYRKDKLREHQNKRHRGTVSM